VTRVYDPDRLYEEVAFVAYHFGWDRETVLEMPHRERQQWCEQISRINERMNREDGGRQNDGGAVIRNPIDGL
jgi:hypothetical protein